MIPPVRLGQAPFAGVLLRIDLSAAGPPWPLQLWSHTAQAWQTVGGWALHGPEPVILGDSDPPDFVLFGGDIVSIEVR